VVRPPGLPPDIALLPIRSLQRENPKTIGEISRRVHSSVTTADEFRGIEVSIPAPYRDGEVPPEPSLSVSIAVSTISIDLTAISIAIAASDDEEGVVLPRG
jgi:hypothetical protein